MKKKTIHIEGMMCMHCKAHVEKALKAVCANVDVVLEENLAHVSDETLDNAILTKAIVESGYDVVSIEDDDETRA